MVRISYHPNFVVYQGQEKQRLSTFSVAPNYLAFVVPFGVESYQVVWTTPLWSSILFWACYTWMIGSLVTGLMISLRCAFAKVTPAAVPAKSKTE